MDWIEVLYFQYIIFAAFAGGILYKR